jgi:hypothetical protein
MSNLSKKQLSELHQAIVERLQEFEMPSEKLPSAGVVRVAYEIIAPFVRGQMTPARDEAEDKRVVAIHVAPLRPEYSDDDAPPLGWGDEDDRVPALIRNGRPPDPDVARENVAQALANGSGGQLASLVGRRSRTLEEVDKGRSTPRGAYIPSERELIAELQRQAMAGVMPSAEAFDDNRPAGWSKAHAQMARLDRRWSELAEMAGLRPNPRTPRRGGDEN